MAEDNTDITEPTLDIEMNAPMDTFPLPDVFGQKSPTRSVKSSNSPVAFDIQSSSQIRTAAQKSPSAPRSPGSIAKTSISSGVKKPDNPRSPSAKSVASSKGKGDIIQTIIDLEPQGRNLSNHVDQLTDSVRMLSRVVGNPPPNSSGVNTNIDKIANMSKVLTDEANALRESIKSLSNDISRTKRELLTVCEEDVNFPYHLFLIELIINKIHMKCECFEFDYNNLVITAAFLGKQPIVLYDTSYGKVDDFTHLNVGKSALFAMTYDKICSIKEFVIKLNIVKQPPCSKCVTKVGEARADYTKSFVELREELCKKWAEEQPNDNILCTTSTPMSKNIFYVWCGEVEKSDSIGIIEISARMSFLGKEITTTFIASPKQQGTTFLQKEDNGMTMFSCQDVEMDGQGKVYLDEDSLNRKEMMRGAHTMFSRRTDSPDSQFSSASSKPSDKRYAHKYQPAGLGEFRIRDLNDEINKLMREKRHWEVQIKALGGPDHARVGPKMLDQDGKEVPGNRGYKYFGAAKDLPGVRELFEQEPPAPARRTRADLMRDVDADYYGYRDDDDGLLIPLEKEAEKHAIARAVEEWKKNKEQNKDQELPEEENIYPEDPDDKRIEDDDDGSTEKASGTSLVAVPSQKDIEEALLRRKKQELLERYGCLDVKLEAS